MIPNFTDDGLARWLKYLLVLFTVGVLASSTGFLFTFSGQVIYLLQVVLFFIFGIWFWRKVKNMMEVVPSPFVFLAKISAITMIVIFIGHRTGGYLFSKFLTGYFIDGSLSGVFSTALLTAFFPAVFEYTFKCADAIPTPTYKIWYYPDFPIIMPNIDVTNVAVITFVISKRTKGEQASFLQSKGPYALKLGDLFYFFVKEWNQKNPAGQIEVENETGVPQGWIFKAKNAWWKPAFHYDPDLTIRENKIRAIQVINARRV